MYICTEITFQSIKKQGKRTRKNIMEYLFLRKKETTATSPKQRDLLFNTAEKQWEKEFALRKRDGREIDREIYKSSPLSTGDKKGVPESETVPKKTEHDD